MAAKIFTIEELNLIKTSGRDIKSIEKQLEVFKKGTPYLPVERAAIPNDGIYLPCDKKEQFAKIGKETILEGKVCKFVPASGAASRMFKDLSQFLSMNDKEEIEGSPVISTFFEKLTNFAFYDDLIGKCPEIKEKSQYTRDEQLKIIKVLLKESGLNYGNLPKAALKFHRYGNTSRTSIEEQMVEGALYTRDKNNICRLHLTVSKEHRAGIASLIEEKLPIYENKYGVHFKVDYSTQSPSTDTIAVNPDNTPFRDEEGVLFRPGGHGALINNLNAIQSTYIIIKNIDNVSPDSMKDPTVFWKKAMTGIAATRMKQCHSHIKNLLTVAPKDNALTKAIEFLNDINVHLPSDLSNYSKEEQKTKILSLLDRPLRICGMVRNQGEPGGGPFWVKGQDGVSSLQIVESSQIKPDERDALMSSGTHFNPVDLVVAKERHDGSYFDLLAYTDEDAVFISQKSKNGKELKALELPGLWNGAMANWNTIFIEVPMETFNPVKTVLDLLRPQHQV